MQQLSNDDVILRPREAFSFRYDKISEIPYASESRAEADYFILDRSIFKHVIPCHQSRPCPAKSTSYDPLIHKRNKAKRQEMSLDSQFCRALVGESLPSGFFENDAQSRGTGYLLIMI